MSKLSFLLIAGLFACVLAVIFREDKAYDNAYERLHQHTFDGE
jgi:hypothetical protein